MNLSVDTKAWSSYPMGPKLRQWLGITAAEYRGESLAEEPLAAQSEAFQDFLCAYSREKPIGDQGFLVDLMDEVFSMNLPIAALKLADLHPDLWQRRDFRGLHIEGLAAMLTGAYSRAEHCFRLAQEEQPPEPAPYVNLIQIMHSDERWDEAWVWLQAGLEACPQHFPLWELLHTHLSARSPQTAFDELLTQAKKLHSWAGLSFAAELDPHKNQDTKALYLNPIYHAGERSPAFLLEYTGALGMGGAFDKIPPIIWEAEKLSAKRLPWQLSMHLVQAHLALQDWEAFRKQAQKLLSLKDSDMPANLRIELNQLIEEVRLELHEEAQATEPVQH